MVNRSGIIEFTFNKKKINKTYLFSDFSRKDEHTECFYVKNEIYKNNIGILTVQDSSNLLYSTMTYFNLNNDKLIENAYNVKDTLTNSIETLESNKNDFNKKYFGFYLFSEKYTDSLRKMKKVEFMTLEDFKSYLEIYFEKLKVTADEFDKYNKSYMGGTSYNFQIITQSLYEIGFNPLAEFDKIELIYNKYSDDKDVEKIIKKYSVK